LKQIETRLRIDATPDEVWSVLMDFPSWRRWNPMVVGISGEPAVGSRLVVTIAIKNGRRMTFRPKVVEYEPGRRFAWLGKVGVPGIFDGLHWFTIEGSGAAATLVHGEEFRGILPPLLGGLLRDTHESIVEMNEALASEVSRRKKASLAAAVRSET
jgi:hypothetical protein